MDVDRALVRTILVHAEHFPWKMQDIGLLGLWLDDQRCSRLHVWDPDSCVDEPVVHDHPFDFTSVVIAGEMTNTRYAPDPDGVEHRRWRYVIGREDERRADTIRLTASSMLLTEGDSYSQRADELHQSRQAPGSVTVIRMDFDDAVREVSVCHRGERPWLTGQARPATVEEIKRIAALALAWF